MCLKRALAPLYSPPFPLWRHTIDSKSSHILFKIMDRVIPNSNGRGGRTILPGTVAIAVGLVIAFSVCALSLENLLYL